MNGRNGEPRTVAGGAPFRLVEEFGSPFLTLDTAAGGPAGSIRALSDSDLEELHALLGLYLHRKRRAARDPERLAEILRGVVEQTLGGGS